MALSNSRRDMRSEPRWTNWLASGLPHLNQIAHIACSAIWLTIGSESLSCLERGSRQAGQPTSDSASAAHLRASQHLLERSEIICAAVHRRLQVSSNCCKSLRTSAGLTASTKLTGS